MSVLIASLAFSGDLIIVILERLKKLFM